MSQRQITILRLSLKTPRTPREFKHKFSTRKMTPKWFTPRDKIRTDPHHSINILSKKYINTTILRLKQPVQQRKSHHWGEGQSLLRLKRRLAVSRDQDSKRLHSKLITTWGPLTIPIMRPGLLTNWWLKIIATSLKACTCPKATRFPLLTPLVSSSLLMLIKEMITGKLGQGNKCTSITSILSSNKFKPQAQALNTLSTTTKTCLAKFLFLKTKKTQMNNTIMNKSLQVLPKMLKD